MRLILVSFWLWLAPAVFAVDPAAIQRFEKAYRYPHAGWNILRIEGTPYERGYQHGKLMAPEIDRFIKTLAQQESSKSPEDGWKRMRTLVGSLFLRGFAPEYLEEMKGIADGATAGGAKGFSSALELIDIACINCWPEVYTLDSALESWPTGLEGKRFRDQTPRSMPATAGEHCSAFAAVGSATADGKVVFGHVTMFGLHLANHFNLWIDIVPEKGHRLVMQSFPGGIHSGMDYYINDCGIMMAETTYKQTRFDPNGRPLASRVRQAMQYGESIEQVCETLRVENNGLYANEWILADVNRNEIALFLLGTHQSKLMRSSKSEWFGGTEGFYWSCNTIKDAAVRLETIPGVEGRPQNLAWRPSDRDVKWQALYRQYKGKIDADFGRMVFSGPGLAKSTALDAKCTTAALAQKMQTWAVYGPPRGWLREPTPEERSRFSDIRPLVPNAWTVMQFEPPANNGPAIARDVPERSDRGGSDVDPLTIAPAWHGTIIGKSAEDIWLGTAFADYERLAALELHYADKGIKPAERDRLAVMLAAYRKSLLSATMSGPDQSLMSITPDETDRWYHISSGKGVLLLNALRQELGLQDFVRIMDSFGRANAGMEVTATQFIEYVRRESNTSVDHIFKTWLPRTALPTCSLLKDYVRLDPPANPNGKWQLTGVIQRPASWRPFSVDLNIETTTGDENKRIRLEQPETAFTLELANKPRRVVLDKYGDIGGSFPFGVRPNIEFLENMTIVYATGADEPANRVIADEFQRIYRTRGANVFVPAVADRDLSNEVLKSQHLLFVGRPEAFRLPDIKMTTPFVTFGSQSFTVRDEVYAHPGSAVLTVVSHPGNPKLWSVVAAGNSGEGLLRTVSAMLTAAPGADVIVLPHRGKDRPLVGIAADQVLEFTK